jgi:hypothetical protein
MWKSLDAKCLSLGDCKVFEYGRRVVACRELGVGHIRLGFYAKE